MIIAHLSDIHIRKSKRHDEYKNVLKNLVNSLESFDVDRIAIVGDLLHNKRDLSPESVDLCRQYLDELSDVAPIDLILGNHDCVINQNSMDSLTPVVTMLQQKGKPINFYTESGLYDIGNNITYGVFAQQDDETKWPISFDKDPNITYIALYHGAINGSKTSISHRIETDTNRTIFDNYDYGMLGDIHSRQAIILDENGKSKVAYSGSLIQQNFGEDTEKGFLLWDFGEEKKCFFVKVANDYGWVTFRLNQEDIDSIEKLEFPDLPARPYVRILLNTKDYSVTTQKRIEAALKKRYHIEGMFIEVDTQDNIDDLSLSGKTENVTDLKTQQDLLRQYFSKRPTVSDQDFDEILSIHKDFYNTCSIEDYYTYKGNMWRIHKVIFENVFSYGVGNVINFNNLRGVTGIFSSNASGKSSILYTILQGFFNCSNRTGGRNVADVIHKNKDDGFIEIEFSIDNKKYTIERTFKRNKKNPNRATNKVSLYEIKEGEKINISGHANVRETEATIRSMLGSYDEHTMTTFSQQFDITSFIDRGQTNRKDLLSRFLGLNVIEDMYKNIKEDTSSIRTLLKEYQSQDYPAILNRLEQQRVETVDIVNKLSKQHEILQEEHSVITTEKDNLNKSLLPILDNLRDIRIIESDKSKAFNNIDRLQLQKNDYDAELKRYNNLILETEQTLSSFPDQHTLSEKVDEYIKFEKESLKLKTTLEIKEQSLLSKKKQTKILEKHDWFQTNEVCKKCTFLTSAFSAQEEMKSDKDLIDNTRKEIEKITEWLTINKDIVEDSDKVKQLVSYRDTLSSKIELIDANISNIDLQFQLEKNKLATYDKEENDYKDNENSIIHNNNINEQLDDVNNKIFAYEQKIRKNNEEILKNKTILGQQTQKIIDLGGNIEVLKEIEKKYNLHVALMDAFSNDGIPLMIMNKTIPILNSEIRKILSNVANFEVSLEIDPEAHDLSIFIDDGTSKRRVELGSGMEKTITALTIRSALSNISLLPTCNLFVIDEGFGTLDSENINHMNMLLSYLKGRFENVLIISHIESMQDITDNVLSVSKNEKGYSSIKKL